MQAGARGVASEESEERGLQLCDIPRPLRAPAVQDRAGLQAVGEEGAGAAAPGESRSRGRLHQVRAGLPAERSFKTSDTSRGRRHLVYVASTFGSGTDGAAARRGSEAVGKRTTAERKRRGTGATGSDPQGEREGDRAAGAAVRREDRGEARTKLIADGGPRAPALLTYASDRAVTIRVKVLNARTLRLQSTNGENRRSKTSRRPSRVEKKNFFQIFDINYC